MTLLQITGALLLLVPAYVLYEVAVGVDGWSETAIGCLYTLGTIGALCAGVYLLMSG